MLRAPFIPELVDEIIRKIRSNTWKNPMISVTTSINVVGERSGNVMDLNFCQAFAPSISAAS